MAVCVPDVVNSELAAGLLVMAVPMTLAISLISGRTIKTKADPSSFATWLQVNNANTSVQVRLRRFPH